jgi:hypothetical protein
VPRKQDSKSSKAGTKSENTAQPLQTKNWLRRKPGPQKRSRAVHEKMLDEAAGRKLKTISQLVIPEILGGLIQTGFARDRRFSRWLKRRIDFRYSDQPGSETVA